MSDARQNASAQGISAHGLRKDAGGRTLFQDIDLSVPPGSIYGLVGPPGSAKTAFLRVVATLDQPDSGQLFICGIPADTYPDEARKRLGYMPQTFIAYEGITVEGYLDFYALVQGISGRDRPAVRDALLELLDLTALREELAQELPLDQRQRLNLARCLIHDPDVLLLDDPSAGMSEDGQSALGATLLDLAGLRKTLLLTGRTEDFTSTVCDAVIRMPGAASRTATIRTAQENPQ